jgi:hypothetical protein
MDMVKKELVKGYFHAEAKKDIEMYITNTEE